MRILRTRMMEREQERLHQERSEFRRNLVGSGDRSQRVRTYNFPQNRVTDHRLSGDVKNFNLEPVLEGRIEPLLEALEELEREERIRDL
jgi:peptide chain release factor 1